MLDVRDYLCITDSITFIFRGSLVILQELLPVLHCKHKISQQFKQKFIKQLLTILTGKKNIQGVSIKALNNRICLHIHICITVGNL